jgi:hypothetical protein
MPKQELFLEEQIGDHRIEVLKTYDQQFAHEAFCNMEPQAQEHLWKALAIADNYDSQEIPVIGDDTCQDFLWEELLETAREEGNLLSFFVVNEFRAGKSEALYVSSDWPSAESFAKNRLSRTQQS